MRILAIGLNHAAAPVEVREKLAFTPGQLRQALAVLAAERASQANSLLESAILSTCNRTEIYALTKDVAHSREQMVRFLSEQHGLPRSDFESHLYTYEGEEALRHLFAVAAGIDSMILGENEILGQVRQAYHLASGARALGPVLSKLFRKSITVGKRARTETAIGRNAISVSYAAVELAKKIFEDLNKCSALVVGAGKMSEQALKNLMDNGVSEIIIMNRSRQKAEAMARVCSARVLGFNRIARGLQSADIVITSTAAPHPVIRPDAVKQAMAVRQHRPLLLVDMAVPRDVDPAVGRIDNVYLYDIDDLGKVVEANLRRRRHEMPKVETIISEEIADFMAWFKALDVLPTITDLRERAEKIRRSEVENALRKLGPLSERQQAVIEALSTRIINKLLHVPTINLKDRANGQDGHLYTMVIRELFGLEDEGEPREKEQAA